MLFTEQPGQGQRVSRIRQRRRVSNEQQTPGPPMSSYVEPSRQQSITNTLHHTNTNTTILQRHHQNQSRRNSYYEYYDNSSQYWYNPAWINENSNGNNYGGFVPVMNRWCRSLFQFCFIVCISVVTYMTFYISNMPYRHVTRPLYFDYNYQTNSVENKRLSAVAVVNLKTKNDVSWEPMVNDVVVLTTKPILSPQQAYYIELILTLPETINNKQGGMFGVYTELFSTIIEENKQDLFLSGNSTIDSPIKTNLTKTKPSVLIATSKRSARFPHTSNWILFIEKIFLLMPLLIHATDETKTIIIYAFRHYVENTKYPLVSEIFDKNHLTLLGIKNVF